MKGFVILQVCQDDPGEDDEVRVMGDKIYPTLQAAEKAAKKFASRVGVTAIAKIEKYGEPVFAWQDAD